MLDGFSVTLHLNSIVSDDKFSVPSYASNIFLLTFVNVNVFADSSYTYEYFAFPVVNVPVTAPTNFSPAGNLSTICIAYPFMSPSLYTDNEYVIISPFSTTIGSFLCLYVAVPFLSMSFATYVKILDATLPSSFAIIFVVPFEFVISFITFLIAKSNSF